MARRQPKYAIPQQYRFDVARHHLLERLRQASDRKLVVLVAPAGYGKTTLLGQFARETSRPVVWLTLTPDDGEVLMLGRSIAEALSLTQPELSLERWQRALRNLAGPGRLAAALAADVNRADDNVIFILESLEHLTESSARWLEGFIRSLGEGHQVMVSHYGDASIDISRFIASGEAYLITTEDLAFSIEETREFLARAMSALEPHLTHEELGGWPAALGMVVHGAPLDTSPKDLVTGILKQLPPKLRSTLPEAAVLEVWNEASARRLGCDLPPAWLRTVRRCGLPLLPLGNGTYRPHGLVLEVLEAALQRRPERCAELHLAAARDAQSQGQLMFALHHLLRGNHHRQALDHVSELLPHWERRSDWVLVRKVLESFPPEHLPPSMKTSLGIALLETGEPAKGEALLRKQIREDEANGMAYFGLTLLYYRRGQGRETLAWAEAGLLVADDARATVQLLRSKAVSLHRLDRLEEAREVAAECVGQAERLGDTGLLVGALTALQYILHHCRHYGEAKLIGRRAVDMAFAAGVHYKALAAVMSLFETHFLEGRSPDVIGLVEEMLAVGESEYPLAVPWMLEP